MFSTFINIILVTLATCHIAAARLSILTPTLTQCQDATIAISGGTPNYGLYVLPSGDPCGDSVVNLPTLTGTSYNWKVNIPAGSNVELLVEDSTGAEAWSGVITVKDSSDASCVDPNAVQALIKANSFHNSSSIAPSPATPQPSTTPSAPTSSYSFGSDKTVTPVASNPANVASPAHAVGTNAPSAAVLRAALPAYSLLGVVASLFALAHLL